MVQAQTGDIDQAIDVGRCHSLNNVFGHGFKLAAQVGINQILTSHGLGKGRIVVHVAVDHSLPTGIRLTDPFWLPQKAEMNTNNLFWRNIGLRGGIASVTTYDKQILLKAVLDGTIHPGKVFTQRFDLDHIQDAYDAMDQRKAIKSLVVVSR